MRDPERQAGLQVSTLSHGGSRSYKSLCLHPPAQRKALRTDEQDHGGDGNHSSMSSNCARLRALSRKLVPSGYRAA
jgi:hypothetical protein